MKSRVSTVTTGFTTSVSSSTRGLMSTHTEILPSRSMMIAQMADQYLMPEQRIRLKMPIASESNVKTQNAIAQLAG